MKYETGIMSNKISIECDNIDQAVCMSMMYFQSQAPIAVYNSDEKSTLTFPYDHVKVGDILASMDVKKAHLTIKKLTD